jgi:hypothetical protein
MRSAHENARSQTSTRKFRICATMVNQSNSIRQPSAALAKMSFENGLAKSRIIETTNA